MNASEAMHVWRTISRAAMSPFSSLLAAIGKQFLAAVILIGVLILGSTPAIGQMNTGELGGAV
jgi:hypothetical protein